MADPNQANPFDQIGDGDQLNPFDQIADGQPAQPKSSAAGAFARGAALGVAPAVGGLAGAGAGAEVGAEIGAIGGPWGAAAGGFIGGVVGGFGGGWAAGKAQDYGVSKLPDSWRDPLEKQEQADQQQHATASFLGGLLPMAATMSPFAEEGAAARLAKMGPNATAMQRLMVNPMTARLFGGALQGGIELGNEAVEGDGVDWSKVAASTAFGLVFNRANSLGQAIEGSGPALLRRARGLPPEAAHAPAAAAEPSPTIAQAQDAKVAGPGITQEVFDGSHAQDPAAAMAAQEQARLEQSLIAPPPTPDVHAIAQRLAPETMESYDAALKQRDAMQRWVDEYTTRDGHPAGLENVRTLLATAEEKVNDLAPQVSAAYRRAAEAIGSETHPPEPIPGEAGAPLPGEPEIAPAAPTPSADQTLVEAAQAPKPIAEQKAAIAADVARQLVAAGRPQEEADAAGHVYAAEIASLAQQFKGQIGTAEELYAREGATIKGADGKTRRIAAKNPPKPKAEAAEPAAAPVELSTPIASTAEAEWARLAAGRQDKAEPSSVETGYNPTTTKAGAALRGKGRQAWEAGNIVDVGFVKDLLIAGPKNAEGEFTLVSKPDRNGESTVYASAPHGGLTKTGRVDFLKATEGLRASEPKAAAEPSAPPATAPQAEPPADPSYGANNTLVSQERAALLRERLKEKLRAASSQLNAGIDPEMMTIGTELAVFHIEAGARRFAAFAATMARDLGATIGDLRPYLRSWYNGARDMMEDHGLDVAGLDSPDGVRSELERVLQEEADAGAAIHQDGAEPLEEVAPEDGQGDAGSGDAERAGPASEQGSIGSGGDADVERVATARGGGIRPAGDDPAAAGKGRVGGARRRRNARAETVAEEAKADNPAFDQSPDVEERETANANVPDTDFVLTDAMNIGKGSEGQKYSDNLAAIRALKTIEAEGRRATPEEKGILSRYVGWGGLKNAFRAAGAREGEGVAASWDKRVAELESLLTPSELRRARNSTTAAHYTSPTVVKSVWAAVKRLGFSGGAVLEPSVGTGNFLGFMPQDARAKSNVFAVEYDDLTARIAQKLYPNADIVHAGFQNVPLPQNQFALAIGNPPFGADRLYFRFNPAVNGRTIHNQFFLASMDGLRPGGLMAMVVSHNMMDALDNSARLALAKAARFLGAVRLPDTAFKENARTEVVTDIVFLQKREADEQEWAGHAITKISGGRLDDKLEGDRRMREAHDEISGWAHSSTIADPAGSGEQINANGYFLRHPEMVVGRINATGTMNRRAELNVTLDRPEEFEAHLAAALSRLPALAPRDSVATESLARYRMMADGMKLSVERAEPGRVRVDDDGAMKTVVDIDPGEGSGKTVLSEILLTKDTPFRPDYTLNVDGKWQKTADVIGPDGKPAKVMVGERATKRNLKQTIVYDSPSDIPERDKWSERNVAALRAMLPIRDAFKKQLQLEMEDAPAAMIADNRTKLNDAYDQFAAEHGQLNDRANEKIARTMPDGGLIMAAEQVKRDGTVEKAPIMSRRVTEPPKPVERAKDAADAVAISLGEHGRIDLDRVAKLLGTDEAGAIEALSAGEEPRAFFDPETSQWEPRDGYLSGLVRKKWLAAQEAGLEANVRALEKVIPEDWDTSQVTPNIGSNWIPKEVYAAFIKHLGYSDARVQYSALTNTFSVAFEGEPKAQWATSAEAHEPGEIVSKLLNSQPVKVTWTDSDGKTHVDEEATTESQLKASEITNEFLDWAYQDDDRRADLVRIFNDKFNNRQLRQRDGSHLTLPGKVPDAVIAMRRHQKDGIWRGVTDRAVLYDHTVGSGKTFTGIARIMERRRMGLSRKPMVTVPNHLVEQWKADFLKLYPGANVLAAGKDDFERVNRRRLFARIAAGDYDATIIGHSSFGFIDIDPSTEDRYLSEQLAEAQKAAQEAAQQAAEDGYSGFGKPLGVKEAERLITKIEARLAKVRSGARDRLLTFEEMGIDDLTVDEAHEFKNLAYNSRLTGVVGMGNKAGSQKATDLNMKVRALSDRPGTSVAFLTGTPISNSVSEMYLLLRNLVPKELKELGLENFDAWRAMYVDYRSEYEPTEAGTLKEVSRLGRGWSNMRSLMDLYYSVADVVTNEDVKKAYAEDRPGEEFPIPKVASMAAGKDREMVFVPPTAEQVDVLKQIVDDFNGLKSIKDPKERAAERLRLYDRARKISLDPRAIDPHAQVSGEGGKIAAIVDRVNQIYTKWNDDKGTQIVFLDRSVPKAKGDEKIVKAYDDARETLRKAIETSDEAGERRAVEALDKYDPNEMESLRSALQGGWNAYDEIKRQLVAKGIPEDEIRFVQEANTDDQKAALFRQVNDGEVRVLIGSTPRMGAGTNVQRLLVGLHHADVTWKPSDIEQREGRIVRQGNALLGPESKYGPTAAADVIAYATERTIDAKMWHLNSEKLRSINKIRKYDGAFNMEFEDEESASMAEAAALATGDPLMLERVTLNGDINKLEVQERSFMRRQNALRDELNSANRAVDAAPKKAADARAFADEIEAKAAPIKARSAERAITIEGKPYRDFREAEAAATARINEIKGDDKTARFSIEVAGQKLTSQDAILEAIRGALGKADFEGETGGKTFISPTQMAIAIAREAEARGSEFTIDNVTLNGIPVEIDVAPYRFGKKQSAKEITFSALNGAGKQMAGFRTIAEDKIGWQNIHAGLGSLALSLEKPEGYRASADAAEHQAAAAGKKIPGLEDELGKTWPRTEDLQTKRQRLREVIAALSEDNRNPAGGDAEEDGAAASPTDREFAQDRGSVKMGAAYFPENKSRATITIFRDADASTAIHEFGHDFLERMKRYALHPAAPEQLKADWGLVKSWLKVKDETKAIPRGAHEKFADTFVQYMREGVAPSKELAGVFAKFRNWLVGVYQTIKGLGQPISPAVRGLFDRMLSEEPQPTVIAPEKARGPSLADIHAADDAETSPQHAEPVADRVVAEATQKEADLHPEIQNETAPIYAKIESERAAAEQAAAEQSGPDGGDGSRPVAGAEPTGQAPAGGEQAGHLGAGGGDAGPEPASGGGGEGSGAQLGRGGEPVSEGAGAPGSEQRPSGADGPVARSAAGNGVPIPQPADVFPARKEWAGNINLDKIVAPEQVLDVIRTTSDENDGFIGDRRGVQTWGQTAQLAEALGMDGDALAMRHVGQAFNAEQAWAARTLLVRSAFEVKAKMDAAAAGGDNEVLAYAQARERHKMIQAQIAGISAEAGRALNIFNRKIEGEDIVGVIGKIVQDETGRTLYQLKREAKLGAGLDTPEKVSKFMNDTRKRSFADMVLEYWINGLTSGPATHATYSIGNSILAAIKAGPDTLAAAAIGGLRNREGPRVYAGEVGANFRGLGRGIAPGLKAAADSFRAGVTAKLPGEGSQGALPFQPGSELTEAPHLDEGASYHDAAGAAFGVLRGIRDAMLTGGALLKAGGIEGEPMWGARYSPQGAIPDFTFRGVGVAPLGTLARAPSRFIAAIHAFFRAANYSMEKSALGYRQAVGEGRTGDDLAQKVGEYWSNPSEGMMKAATREATDLTLMGPGGEFTRALSRLTNAPIFGIKLLKFIDPFVHISGAIIEKALLERTPVGLLSPELRADLLGKNGNIAQDRAQARMLVGSALAMGFGGLAASGYASGSGPSDPRQAAMWRLAGNQAHSVRIGDIWYDVHRLGPMGMLLGIAADMYDVAHVAEQGDMLKAGAALQHAITQNILDESFMRGPADLIQAVEDPGRYGEAYLRNWASSFVPYSVGMAQMARAADPYSRQARTVMDAVKNKIPGLSEDLFKRRDIWGEPMANPDALVAAGVTAIYERQMSRDPVNLAMLNLGIAPASVERKIRNVALDDGQYDDYARISGRMTKMRLDAIVRAPDFQRWPAHVQHDVLAETIRQSREAARGLMMMKYPSILRQATDAKLAKLRGDPTP